MSMATTQRATALSRPSPAKSAFPKSSQRITTLARHQLIRGLRADYQRACHAVYAYAYLAERLQKLGRDELEQALCQRGMQQVLQSLMLAEIRGQLGDTLPLPLDEMEAMEDVQSVAHPSWHAGVAMTLRRRALLCDSLGEWELASQLRAMAKTEAALPPLLPQ